MKKKNYLLKIRILEKERTLLKGERIQFLE